MIQFTQSDTSAAMIFTLTENVSIYDPYFLLVFTHILTKKQIKFVKFSGADESNYTERYNQFTIDPSVVFANAPVGQWNYTVYEQASSTNVDESLTGPAVEYGKLLLDRSPAFSFTKYNQAVSFNTYNG